MISPPNHLQQSNGSDSKKGATIPFCHLHNHSEYSILDGASRVQDLVQKAVQLGHQAVALTDHGNMFGAIDFYSTCKKAGLNPIIGCEIFHEGQQMTKELLKEQRKSPGCDAYHLVLLAKSTKGYHSLMKIVSYGQLHIQNQIPVVTETTLNTESIDIIALSGCLKGEFGQLVTELYTKSDKPYATFSELQESNKDISRALLEHVQLMERRFGKGHYYIELIDNNLAIQKKMLPLLVEAADFFGLPIVATCDSHYIEAEFSEAHAVLTAVKNDLTYSKLRDRDKRATFHLLNNEEMASNYSCYKGALENTLKIAESCNIEIEFGKFFLPEFDLKGEDVDAALRRISKEGLLEKFDLLKQQYGKSFDTETQKIYSDRLEHELSVIIDMGFPGYFLIVQDFINWAKKEGIPVGPGRGSGAGSLVAYALKITDLDPIPLNLIFERFLNPERISMPDFDVDFCQSRRDEVIDYVSDKYGEENVAQIITFGKMKAKAALRDVGRVLEISYKKVDRIAKLIPNELEITLNDALAREPRLGEEANQDPSIDKMIHIALQVEGLNRHTSIHAAGIVISKGGMENFVPVLKSEDGALVTQYEMKNAEKVGLVKFDFLGLKTLTVVQKAVDIIVKRSQSPFNIETIDLEDAAVYQEISKGNTCAVFQLESTGMRALNLKLKPSCFEDIIAVVALFRPGPLSSGMVDDFIERKHGRQKINYVVPQLESILADTYGIILYQEQVQKIAATLANYSLGEADILRRAMGKKKPEEMAKQKSRFVSGAAQNGISNKVADDIFELMANFAAYGFNKSHSAAYGLVSYQTAFLKTHYPAEFLAAIMTLDMDNTDKIVRYVEELRRLKFTINPPDINTSDLEFSVPKDKTINFSLTAIKGIGTGPLLPIIKEREERGIFTSLTDLCKRVNMQKVGKKTLELLNEAGALSNFGSKPSILEVIPEMVKFSEHHHGAKTRGQGLLFAEDSDENSDVKVEWEEGLKSKTYIEDPMIWLLKEKKLLGVFLTHHPSLLFKEDTQKFSSFKIGSLAKFLGKKNLALVCFLNKSNIRLTKSGKKMAYLLLEDETGQHEAVMFEKELTSQELPQSETMVVCQVSISKSYDNSSINVRVENIWDLEKHRKKHLCSVTLKFNLSDKKPAWAKKLFQEVQSTVESFEGTIPFDILLTLEKAEIKIEPEQEGLELTNSCYQKLKSLSPRGLEVILK